MAYFRGRELYGRSLNFSSQYQGIVVESTEKKMPKEHHEAQEEDGSEGAEELAEEVSVMEEKAAFNEMLVWGHDALPDDLIDPYVRGVEEWIAFAERVRSLLWFFGLALNSCRYIRILAIKTM